MIVHIMKRLDQGHLHPKLEGSRLKWLGRESNPGLRSVVVGKHSSKVLFEKRGNT
jgi:hypothetical protein